MTDIELIVKIDANVYTRLFDNGIQDNEIATDDICEMARSLRCGTPLPKGHGRILDEKDILDIENNDGGWYDLVDMPEYIAGIKAIIEADRAESEG